MIPCCYGTSIPAQELTSGINDFAARCHARGVRFFLPYKPWDIRFGESSAQTLEMLTELIRSTDIDRVWFDTMNSVPSGFREKLDSIRPGILFCIEGSPATIQSVETITGFWDQHRND